MQSNQVKIARPKSDLIPIFFFLNNNNNNNKNRDYTDKNESVQTMEGKAVLGEKRIIMHIYWCD